MPACVFWRLVLAVLCTALLGSEVLAETSKPRVLVAAPLAGDQVIRVDGVLDEPAWNLAPVGTDFLERTPVPRADPPTQTRVRVLFDRDALYVGVEMDLLPDETPRALELKRDSFRIFSDDAISLKFDIRHDKRTTIGFATNPAGTQVDYVALDNGGQFRREFDMVWTVSTTVNERSWIAEFRIPVEALGLAAWEGERVLGFNVTRDHNARLATDDWTHLPPEFGAVAALYYGELHGLRDLRGGVPITVIPYVLGEYEKPAEDELGFRAGGSLSAQIAESLWTELTLFTDFAQVDLDDPVVNLDRFPLFLPERRPFFLSGLEIFDFGESGIAQMFFSRRVGLDARGEEVPIIAGLKTFGRVGDVELGLLQVVTDDGPMPVDPEDAQQQSGSWTVVRGRLNFTKTSHLGTMFTARGFFEPGPTESDSGFFFDPSYAIGLDGAARPLDRLELSGFVSTTISEETGSTADGTGAFAQVRFRDEAVQPAVSALFLGDDYDPAIGFVRRDGIFRIRSELPWIHRTTALSLSDVTTTASGEVTMDRDLEDELEKRGSVETSVRFRSGYGFGLGIEVEEDLVDEAFTLFDDLEIAPGRYRGAEVSVSASSPSARNPNLSLEYAAGTSFFSEEAHRVSASGGVGIGPHLSLSLAGNANFIFIPDRERIDVLTAYAVVSIAPTTTLFVDLVSQFDNIRDTTILFSRLKWRYLPGSDIFLVYREDVPLSDQASSGRSLTLKANYRFDAAL